ncbi:hypothetical protein OTK49_26720 [Vibrio coralliirubri]|uniref:hypothetical protein n=1 Tax=Vibrio coralliirubri TaxID=1516159 RepID=UPI00228475A2|nr:hypothetical protein [Vibrio coralliirubri]MCY9866135.1 hypothetical protein [Vibrio coralliirubri]
MKWELSGKDTVIIEDVKFHVGANWLPAIKEKAGFSRKMKVNNQLITSSATMGCIIEEKECAQIASCAADFVGLPLLAPNFFGKANSLYFARVTEDLYWVVSFDADGCVDVASDSDSIKELYPLRDFIREVVDLSDASDSFKIYNIGERVYLDEPTIDPRIIHNPLTEDDVAKLVLPKFKVKRQAGNLKTKLYTAGVITIGGVGIIAHTMVTSLPQEIIDIKDGEHSRSFTNKYNKFKKQFNTIVNDEKKSQRMSDEKVILLGKDEFNDYILSRGLTNEGIINNVLHIREATPLAIEGWTRAQIEYGNDKFTVEYLRDGEYPISGTYRALDEAFITFMKEQHDLTVTPVSLSPKGEGRSYDVMIKRQQQKEYSTYIESKRSAISARSVAMAKMRQTQQELDSAKRAIEGAESSVDNLGVFNRRDKDAIQYIVSKIESVQDESGDTLVAMSSAIDEYKAVTVVTPPEHPERLLGEMGIEQNLFPIFQSTNLYSWSTPVETHSFPSGIADEGFKDKKIIKGSSITLKVTDGVFGVWSVRDVIEKPYIFVDGVEALDSNEGSTVSITISINELNQDYNL